MPDRTRSVSIGATALPLLKAVKNAPDCRIGLVVKAKVRPGRVSWLGWRDRSAGEQRSCSQTEFRSGFNDLKLLKHREKGFTHLTLQST